MPFLLAPNMWKKIYHPKKSEIEEKEVIKDGILVGIRYCRSIRRILF